MLFLTLTLELHKCLVLSYFFFKKHMFMLIYMNMKIQGSVKLMIRFYNKNLITIIIHELNVGYD